MSFYYPFALGSACSSQTGSKAGSPTDGAGTAKTGGLSSASVEPSTSLPATPESVEPAAASADPLAGWRLDDAPVFGHRVVRSAVLANRDLHLVLSAGEAGDSGPDSFEIPESVLSWLLTGAR